MMEEKQDIQDFLKKEDPSSKKQVKEFLERNKILN